MRFVRFDASSPTVLGWGALTPWGRGASAWSDQAPRRFDAGDDVALFAAVPDLTARRLDRFGLLALAAARETLTSASGGPRAACGVVLGSGHGCAASNRLYGEDLARLPPRELRPALFVRTISGSAAADVSIALQLRGASQTFVSGATAGAEALVSVAAMSEGGFFLAGGIEAPAGGGDASRLEAAAFALLLRGGAPKRLRLTGAALGRDVEGGGTRDLIVEAVRDGCDLTVVANPAPADVLSLWRRAAGRARVLDLGAHGDLGAVGAVLGAGLSDAGCDRGALVVARDPSGETAVLRLER